MNIKKMKIRTIIYNYLQTLIIIHGIDISVFFSPVKNFLDIKNKTSLSSTLILLKSILFNLIKSFLLISEIRPKCASNIISFMSVNTEIKNSQKYKIELS